MGTTTLLRDGRAEIYSCKKDVQGTLRAYIDASTIFRRYMLSLSLHVSLATIENTSGTANDLLEIIRDLDFDANLFNIKVYSIPCYQKFSDYVTKKHKK